jgi:acetyl esterase/lipase
MDVYLPPASTSFAGQRRGAVLLIHGGAGPETEPKDWGIYQSWGRLVAASGLVGVTFTHRLVDPGFDLRKGAADVADAVAWVRANAVSLGVDPDRIGLVGFSAGGALLAPALRDPQPYVKALVDFYGYLDLAPSDLLKSGVPAADIAEFSAIRSLAAHGKDMPPLFIARAGRDEVPGMNAGIDGFVAAALAANAPLTLANHPGGVHGFDTQTDDDRSREIVRQVIDFLQLHLGAAGR